MSNEGINSVWLTESFHEREKARERKREREREVELKDCCEVPHKLVNINKASGFIKQDLYSLMLPERASKIFKVEFKSCPV